MRKNTIFVFLILMLCIAGDVSGYIIDNLIKADTKKIKLDTESLQSTATADSIVTEHIFQEMFGERYLMSRKALQTGNSKADTLAKSFYSFNLTANADSTFGVAVQLLGADDTPIKSGNVEFDIHEILVTAVNSTSLYKLRIIWGASAAAGVTAGDYRDLWVFSDSTNPQYVGTTGTDISMPVVTAGTLLWGQIANAAGAQTLSFVFTITEHE